MNPDKTPPEDAGDNERPEAAVPLKPDSAQDVNASAPQAGTTISPQAPAGQRVVNETDAPAPGVSSPEPAQAPTAAQDGEASAAGNESAGPGQQAGQQYAAAAPARHPSKKKKGLVAALIAVIAVLVLAGGAAWAYFGYYVPNRPENVLKAALANSFSADKINSVSLNGEVHTNDNEGGRFEVSFEGGFAEGGRFDVSASLDLLVTSITIDARSLDGETFYIRGSNLEGLTQMLGAGDDATVQAYAAIISSLEGQWIDISRSFVEQSTGTSGSPLLAGSDLDKFVQAYNEHPFLSVQEVLPGEQINGTDSHHYRIAIDKAAFEAFARTLRDAEPGALSLSEEQLEQLLSALEDTDFKDNVFDAWITKGTKQFSQISFAVVTDDDTTVDARITFTAYNEPVEVEEPQDAKSILEILGGSPVMRTEQHSRSAPLLEDRLTETRSL